MGRCKDCKHWEEINEPNAHRTGLCHGLSFSYMNGIFSGLPSLEGQIKGAAPEIRTHDWFSCIYFEEKPKGPFFVSPLAGGLVVHYGTGLRDVIHWFRDTDSGRLEANTVAATLNKLWPK